MKVFQILNNICYWQTPYRTVAETIGKYPADVKFVEAPDYVHESWGYQEEDADGNPITGDDRFIKPTPPEGWEYDEESGTFYPVDQLPVMLAEAQEQKQNENKMRFAEYLKKHPLTWTDGKTYGVTLEDQQEIELNLSQYQLQVQAGIENPVLEWHAQHEACKPWTVENLTALAIAISQYVYPWFQKMNLYKEQIYSAETREEVYAIDLVYEEEVVEEPVEANSDAETETTDGSEEVVEDKVEE